MPNFSTLTPRKYTEAAASHQPKFAALACCILPFVLFITSCVSTDKYDALAHENSLLKNELDGIKFGAPAMLSDAKKFMNSKDFVNSKNKLEALISKYPELPAAAEAKLLLNEVNEELVWQSATNTDELFFTESYLNNYPRGRYQNVAKQRISDLKARNETNAYQSAQSAKTSKAWKAFRDQYPNRSDIADIETKIIELEVDEIYGNSATGRLPPSTSIGYNPGATSSSVNITNDTGCELIVRYSGPSIKSVSIGAGRTVNVYLENGSYRIAASACGSNYAGSEALTGSYSSRYYIITTRY